MLLPRKDSGNRVANDSTHFSLSVEDRKEGGQELRRGDELDGDDSGLKEVNQGTHADDEGKTCSTRKESSVPCIHAFNLVADNDLNQLNVDDSILNQLENNKKQGNSSQEIPHHIPCHTGKAKNDEEAVDFNDARLIPKHWNHVGEHATDEGGFTKSAGASGGTQGAGDAIGVSLGRGSLIDDGGPSEGAVPGGQDNTAALPVGTKYYPLFNIRAVRPIIRPLPKHPKEDDPQQVQQANLAGNVPSGTSDQKTQSVLQKESSAKNDARVKKVDSRAQTPGDEGSVDSNTPVASTSRTDPAARAQRQVSSRKRLRKADVDEDEENSILSKTPSSFRAIRPALLKQRFSLDVGKVDKDNISHTEENHFKRLVAHFCGNKKNSKAKKNVGEEKDEDDEEKDDVQSHSKNDKEDDEGEDKKEDNDSADYEDELIIRMVRKPKDANDKVFIVVWRHWNLSACTLSSLNDLKGSEYNLEEFIRYDRTCTLLVNRHNKVKSTNSKAKRQELGLLSDFYGCWLTDQQWKQEKGTPTHFKKHFGLWAWIDKAREWNEVERAFHPGQDHYPLYLEHFHDGAKLPSDFKFISENFFTASVCQLVDTMNSDRRHPDCECSCSEGICDNCYHRYGNEHEPCSLIKNGMGKIHKGGERSRCFYTVICDAGTCKEAIPCCYPRREYSLLIGWRPDVNGVGVYATGPIPAWKVVCEYTGEVINEKDANLVEMNYQFGIPKSTLVIDAKHMGSEARFVNHSCEPNCGLLTVYEGGVLAVPKMFIVTLMNIKQGDELLIDYHPTHAFDKNKSPPPNSSKCFCAAKKCRQYV